MLSSSVSKRGRISLFRGNEKLRRPISFGVFLRETVPPELRANIGGIHTRGDRYFTGYRISYPLRIALRTLSGAAAAGCMCRACRPTFEINTCAATGQSRPVECAPRGNTAAHIHRECTKAMSDKAAIAHCRENALPFSLRENPSAGWPDSDAVR